MKQAATASAPWDSGWAGPGSGRIGEVTEAHISGSPMRHGTTGSGITIKADHRPGRSAAAMDSPGAAHALRTECRFTADVLAAARRLYFICAKRQKDSAESLGHITK